MIEERPEIAIQNVVHLPAGDPDREGVERVMGSPSRMEPVGEPEEVLLVDRVHHRHGRALDDLVLQGRDRLVCLRVGGHPA